MNTWVYPEYILRSTLPNTPMINSTLPKIFKHTLGYGSRGPIEANASCPFVLAACDMKGRAAEALLEEVLCVLRALVFGGGASIDHESCICSLNRSRVLETRGNHRKFPGETHRRGFNV